jgi:hypothetical protein
MYTLFGVLGVLISEIIVLLVEVQSLLGILHHVVVDGLVYELSGC